MRVLVLPVCWLAAGPSLAEGPTATPGAPTPSAATDCYCTDSTGGRVELGESICLTVDGRSFIAQCQMSLNNPMWREISEGCAPSS
ncbi:hypothetical protein [Rhodosalinus sp. 5P4]|uniref:hypothetical protein n=1 Tax=Rhodosalinus sp. 5P4 TaxID=3239196 RepID=UPI003524BD79